MKQSRRDLFKAFTGGLTAAGISGVAVQELSAHDPAKALVVLTCHSAISQKTRACIKHAWDRAVAGTEWEQSAVVVLDDQISIDVKAGRS